MNTRVVVVVVVVVVVCASDNDGAILEPTQPISQGVTVLSVLFWKTKLATKSDLARQRKTKS